MGLRSVLLVLCVFHLYECGKGDAPTHGPAVSCEAPKKKILCLHREYSKFDLPFRNDHNVIDIGIEISDVLKIDDKDYSITFSLYFNVQWSEPRLNLSVDFFNSENITSEDHLVPVNLELIHDLWVPNIFIYNLKTFKVIDVLSKLAGLWINSKKEIYYSQATHITFICPMLFDSFPLDTQVCKFQVGSYSYDMTKMLFNISHLTFIQKQSIILDYSIEILNLKPRDKIFLAGALGNYSLAGFQMNLRRHVMSYIITYYLPSGLFVVVSWISFLIPPDIVPGRMALLITLFLVLINIFNNITTNSPKAEGLTAIEIWMLACILFVFGTLIEYAVILFKKQKRCKYGVAQAALARGQSLSASNPAHEYHQMASFPRPPNNEEASNLDPNRVGEVMSKSSSFYETQFNHSIFKYDANGGIVSQILPTSGGHVHLIQHSTSPQQQLPATTTSILNPTTNSNNIMGMSSSNPFHDKSPNANGANTTVVASDVNGEEAEQQQLISTTTLTQPIILQGTTQAVRPPRSPVNFVFQQPHAHFSPTMSNPHAAIPSNIPNNIIPHRPHIRSKDSFRRRRRQSVLDKHYSTWHDRYSSVDRFFLYFTPLLFFIFNFFYWGYFYVWGLFYSHNDNTEKPIEMPTTY